MLLAPRSEELLLKDQSRHDFKLLQKEGSWGMFKEAECLLMLMSASFSCLRGSLDEAAD